MRCVTTIWLLGLVQGCADAHVAEITGVHRIEGDVPPGDTAADETGDTGPPAAGSDAGGGSSDDPQDTGDSGPSGTWVCAEEIRNGSEICDDAAFGVPDPYTPLAIVCVNGEGGVGYVSANTGPTMSDGIARCQGWEENGQNAWEHLDYIDQIDCVADGQTHQVNLSGWSGQTLWVGSHDQPDGSGHMTHVCIAHWTP